MDQYTFTTRVDADPADAEQRIRQALADEGLGILTEIDVQATLKQKLGLDMRPYTILGTCNPRWPTRPSRPTRTSAPCCSATSSSAPTRTAAASSSPPTPKRCWPSRRTPTACANWRRMPSRASSVPSTRSARDAYPIGIARGRIGDDDGSDVDGVVVAAVHRPRGRSWCADLAHAATTRRRQHGSDARDALDERYARGEIDRDEYEERRSTLDR